VHPKYILLRVPVHSRGVLQPTAIMARHKGEECLSRDAHLNYGYLQDANDKDKQGIEQQKTAPTVSRGNSPV